MKISTQKIFHPATHETGETFIGYFLASEEDDESFFLYDPNFEHPIAYISYTYIPEKDLLFINDMEHYAREKSRYKGIGFLLHEFIIYQASKLSRPPTIQLMVAFDSYGFHYRFGFRFLSEDQNALMEDLIANKLDRERSALQCLSDSMVLPPCFMHSKLRLYRKAFTAFPFLFKTEAEERKASSPPPVETRSLEAFS